VAIFFFGVPCPIEAGFLNCNELAHKNHVAAAQRWTRQAFRLITPELATSRAAHPTQPPMPNCYGGRKI
jgi:hypothetical protein